MIGEGTVCEGCGYGPIVWIEQAVEDPLPDESATRLICLEGDELFGTGHTCSPRRGFPGTVRKPPQEENPAKTAAPAQTARGRAQEIVAARRAAA